MPFTALAVGSIAAPVIGGILGNMTSGKERDAAAAAAARAQARIDAVGAPPDLSKAIIMEEFKSAGVLTPQMEQNINAGFSQVSQIKEDPTLRSAQASALDLMQQTGRTGFGAQDRAALNKVRNEAARDAEAKRQQIVQNFMARGQGGGGAELMSQLQSAQGSANQASEEGDRVASEAAQRALSALSSGAQLSGQMRTQDFNVANTKAAAADEFQRFNIQNQMARQQRNVDRSNEAQQYNLSNAQRTQDMNTSMNNEEKLRQSNAQRQYWSDKLSMATGQAAQDNQEAARHTTNADRTGQMWQSIGSGIGAGAGALYANHLKYPETTPNPTTKSTTTVAGGAYDDDTDPTKLPA